MPREYEKKKVLTTRLTQLDSSKEKTLLDNKKQTHSNKRLWRNINKKNNCQSHTRNKIDERSITIIMIIFVHSHFSFNTLVPSLTSLNVSPVAHCVNLGVRNKRCRDGKQCPYCTSIKTGTLSPPLVHVLQKRSGRRKPGSQGLHPSYKLDTTLPPTAYLLKKKI